MVLRRLFERERGLKAELGGRIETWQGTPRVVPLPRGGVRGLWGT
jgi:hypothetical protein